MSSSTIRYRDQEFVANDTPIELWMLEVTCQIDTDSDVAAWIIELKVEWRVQATSGFGFGPAPALDKFLNTDDRRKQLTHYFRNALEELSNRNCIITPEELRQSGGEGEQASYTQSLPTQTVINVGNHFVTLIL